MPFDLGMVISFCKRTVGTMGLSLKLFGQFEIRDSSGTAQFLPTRKTRALLGYLAINADQPQPRERLMALLWSDRGERQARQSLNHALRAIRKLAEQDGVILISSDAERVTLRGDVLESDAGRFRELVDLHPDEAAALYTGPFLDGLSVQDPAFEEWLLATQSELHTLACDALAEAAASSDGTGAIAFLQRLLALDPLREAAHRQLMRLLHQSGDRAGALRQYQACADILKRDLRVDPDATTRALHEQIKRDPGVPKPSRSERPDRSSLVESASKTRQVVQQKRLLDSGWQIAVAVVVLLVAGSGLTIWFTSRIEPTDMANQASPSLYLAGKPSIAVLPFTNLSGDPEQEYFSDGITGDLITDLSKVSGLFVIARNSSFAYKGRSIDLREIGRELGVRYLLEGTVRKSGNRVRINAQFIDVRTGGHVWAERFDHKLEDVFTLQDEVTRKIVSALAVKLKPAERRGRNAKIHPEAYDLFLRGLERLRRYTPETNAEAREFFHAATTIDPRYARAIAAIGFSYVMDNFLGTDVDRTKTLGLAERYATAALGLDDSVPAVHVALSAVNQRLKRYGQAVQAAERAVEIDANYADGYAVLATALIRAGRPREGLTAIQTALRLDPQRPFRYLTILASAQFMLGRYGEAARILEQVIEKSPSFIDAHRWLAASYAHLGKKEEAKWEAAEILTLQPEFSLRKEWMQFALKREEDMERYIGGLRMAGLPD